MKKIFLKILIIITSFMLLDSCGASNYQSKKDAYHPCTPNQPYFSNEECLKWEKEYSAEYKKYLNRRKKQFKNGQLEKFKYNKDSIQ